jgi:type IV secretory pathway VirB2 component (pilin)
MGLGVAVAVIGIVVGGLMRATAWGSEQRIAMSNKAITCAVIGLVIVLLGVTLGGQIPTWFGNAGGSCKQLIK